MNEYIRLFLFASTWSLSKLPRGHTIPHNLHMLSTHTPFQLSHWPPVNPTFFFLHVCVCKRPLCCVWAAKHRSEEWLPVKKWLLFQLENWSVCGLSVCRSVCLPSSFPSALRGRRHFRRDRRVTGSIAKAIAPCQHSHLHWNWKQRGSWAAWQHCGGGDDTSQLLRTESVVALRSSIFLLTSFRSSFHLVWGFLGEDYKS